MQYLTEAVLYYIWQYGCFHAPDLKTTKGENITIIQKGRRNLGQGPDFIDAKLIIDGIQQFGAIEMHLSTQEWYQHHHETDANYNSVILHVVHTSGDQPARRQDGTVIPELEISSFVDQRFIDIYQRLHQSQTAIACKAIAPAALPPLTAAELVQFMAVERLEQKAAELQTLFERQSQSWRETLWISLLGVFGGRHNRFAFEQIAQCLPYLVILKHRTHRIEIEALLFGASGFLENYEFANPANDKEDESTPADPYIQELKLHWTRLKLKYGLPNLNAHIFYFGKVRPPNFPTIRLAQLAALTHYLPDIHNLIETPKASLPLLLNIRASEAWNTRYQLDAKAGKPLVKTIGKDFAYNIIINCLAPLGLLYFQTTNQNERASEIIELLESLPAEKNAVIDEYLFFNVRWKNALQTQALLQLNKHYCLRKRCMECPAGRLLLRKS